MALAAKVPVVVVVPVPVVTPVVVWGALHLLSSSALLQHLRHRAAPPPPHGTLQFSRERGARCARQEVPIYLFFFLLSALRTNTRTRKLTRLPYRARAVKRKLMKLFVALTGAYQKGENPNHPCDMILYGWLHSSSIHHWHGMAWHVIRHPVTYTT
jgi:hypothetical protein